MPTKETELWVRSGGWQRKVVGYAESSQQNVVKDKRPRGVWTEIRKQKRVMTVKHKQVYDVYYMKERTKKKRVKRISYKYVDGKVRRIISREIVQVPVFKRKRKKITSSYLSSVPYISTTHKTHYDLSMPRDYSASFGGWNLERPGSATACHGLESFFSQKLVTYDGYLADVLAGFGHRFVGQDLLPLSRMINNWGSSIAPFIEDEDELWSSALTKAQNDLVDSARHFDLGTTIGEAKESVQMFRDIAVDIYKTLKKLRKSALSKEMYYFNRPKPPTVDKYGVTHDFQAWLSAGGDPKQWLKQAAKDLVTSKGEPVAEAAAEAWLLSRYGLQPLASSLVDAYTALSVGGFTANARFQGKGSDSSKDETVLMDLTGYKHIGYRMEVLRRTETIVKCKLGGDMDARFSEAFRLGMMNPVGIAWELVPLSFVADWFLAIGDALQQLDIEAAFTPVYWSKTVVKRSGTVIRVSLGQPELFPNSLWNTYAFTSVNVPYEFCKWENENPEQRTAAGYQWIYNKLQAQCNSEPLRVFERSYGGGTMSRKAHFSSPGVPVGYFPTQGLQLGSLLNFKRSLDLAALFKQIVF